jgi:hypothetical protein
MPNVFTGDGKWAVTKPLRPRRVVQRYVRCKRGTRPR